jgi:hypothetical protein
MPRSSERTAPNGFTAPWLLHASSAMAAISRIFTPLASGRLREASEKPRMWAGEGVRRQKGRTASRDLASNRDWFREFHNSFLIVLYTCTCIAVPMRLKTMSPARSRQGPDPAMPTMCARLTAAAQHAAAALTYPTRETPLR